jgi:hypothetical protein
LEVATGARFAVGAFQSASTAIEHIVLGIETDAAATGKPENGTGLRCLDYADADAALAGICFARIAAGATGRAVIQDIYTSKGAWLLAACAGKVVGTAAPSEHDAPAAQVLPQNP